MKNRLLLILMIIILLFPNSIQAETTIDSVDPLYGEQWALKNIGFESAGLSEPTADNKLLGKEITSTHGVFHYEEKPFFAENFLLKLDSTKIRRLSVELANPQGNWTLEARNNLGVLLAKNSSSYRQIDLLLPKGVAVSELSISLKKINSEWSEPPVIKKLIGAQSSIIAVIDSGAIEHEDFCDNILYSLGADYREGMELPIDTNGHGTHVTGIIAACEQNGVGITGAIGGAEIDVIPLKVLGANGLTDDFALAKAVQTAIKYEVDVINISIAGKGITEVFEKEIRKALSLGIPVVAAAGNGNESTENVYPANIPGVITVAGVNQYNKKVPRSNFGWEVDISAPGFEILSSYLSPSYMKITGTSMATPYVSSVIAYYKQINPELDFIQIRSLLAKHALDLGGKGYDIYTGAGLVQFSRSMDGLRNIEWLNLKENQPVENKSSLVLGFSRELIGKTVVVFKDERLFKTVDVDEMLEEVSLNETKFTLHDNQLEAVVVDTGNQVLDHTMISVVNSNVKVNTGEFIDVPQNHWAFEEISAATQSKLVNGYPNGSFKPSENISRRQSMMMLNRLFAGQQPTSLSIPFKDVTLTTSGILAILTGSEYGYIKGTNGYFYPEKKLTRGQMALILARALELPDNTSINHPYPFKDVPQKAEYYKAVQTLSNLGIITKQPYYRPNETINRAQFAAMLIRTQQALNKK